MNPGVKLGAFVLVLAATLGAGAGVGSIVGPLNQFPDTPDSHTDQSHTDQSHTDQSGSTDDATAGSTCPPPPPLPPTPTEGPR